ncbi:coagulation factor XIII B chain-like isoform X1 [Ascaphus truei]|uniref:coagulation factor XIII B chain-like isoform X1 n=1 Tax=Ascaphus truei TaxID=8439 RepID=UPI003F5A1543
MGMSLKIYKLWIFILTPPLICPPTCNAEDGKCDLPNVENGKIAQYFYIFKKFYFPMEEGKKLSLSCAAGYTSQSGKQEEQITCTAQAWIPAPMCFKKCIRPSLDNGIVHNAKESYKILDTVHYSCSAGYITPSGNATEEIQCSSIGWSPPLGCHQISDTCEAPRLENGRYSSTERVFRTTARLHYECDGGFHTASGSAAGWVECLPRGWSSIPRCTRLTCLKLELVENGGFYPQKMTYVDRDVVQFFCRENYSLKGSELIQCYFFGWSPEPPTCEETRNKCPPPPRPAHAIPLTDRAIYRDGDAVRYECDNNYMLVGREEIHCENGQWTSPPFCVEVKEKIRCGQPPPTGHGSAVTRSEGYHSGDTVRYQCADGYRIEGSIEITCKAGKWPQPPTCNAASQYCRTPPAIRNGELVDTPSDTYSSGSSMEYRCHNYHLMEGPKTVRCAHGAWSELPVCLEPCKVSAEEMGPRNLELRWSFEMTSYFLHGDTVEFTCKDGYDVSSHSELKGPCRRGHIPYPKCVRKDAAKACVAPPPVRNGSVNSSQDFYDSGSSVGYRCSTHHFLQGSSTLNCFNGEWDTTPPTCIEPCVLSQEEMQRNEIKLRWSFDEKDYFFHGEFVEFLCNNGYSKNQQTVMFELRSQCSYGKLHYPTCLQRQR